MYETRNSSIADPNLHSDHNGSFMILILKVSCPVQYTLEMQYSVQYIVYRFCERASHTKYETLTTVSDQKVMVDDFAWRVTVYSTVVKEAPKSLPSVELLEVS